MNTSYKFKKGKYSMKKGILVVFSLFLISFFCIYIFLTKEYNNEISVLKIEINDYNSKLTIKDEKVSKYLKKSLKYYSEIKETDFLKNLSEINNKTKYSILFDKKTSQDLDIDNLKDKIKKIKLDSNEITKFIQINNDIDNEIKNLLSFETTTYKTLVSSLEELLKRNDDLKKKISEIVFSDFFKDSHSLFLESLTYRKSFITYMIDFCLSDVEKLNSEAKIKQLEKTLFFSFNTNEISENKDKYNKMQNQALIQYKKAGEMFQKYNDLMGNDISNINFFKNDNNNTKNEINNESIKTINPPQPQKEEIKKENINLNTNNKTNDIKKEPVNDIEDHIDKNNFENIKYSGIIGKNIGIHINLTRNGNNLTGIQYYDISKKNITVEGSIDENNEFVFYELDTKDKTKRTGVFKGRIFDINNISGIWSTPDEKTKLNFKINKL